MFVNIEDIKISDRIRHDLGDVDRLASSIEQIGLIHPVIITDTYELLSGYRRIQACKKLGWDKIEVRVVNLGDNDVKKLDWEYHENFGRKDLAEGERENYFERREELTKPVSRGFWQKVKDFFARLVSFFKRDKNK